MKDLLRFTPKGIYCEQADVFIDPWRAVDRAIITHGHADHARSGNGSYIAHGHTVSIMRHRLGNNNYKKVRYGETVSVNGVKFTFIPAGHILGSCQVKVEYRGRVEVVTGDYKLQNDGISGCYEPIPCHKLITECTFGLPIYRWADIPFVTDEINRWVNDNADDGVSSILYGYSLGKAQRLLHMLETDLPIYVHGAVDKMTDVYRRAKVDLPPTTYLTPSQAAELPCVVISPPSADNSKWLNKFKPYSTAFSSGWMALRGPRRWRSMDKGFVVSDHMDWDGLATVMKETDPDKVVCTHGYTDIYAKHLREQGFNAVTEKTEFSSETPD